MIWPSGLKVWFIADTIGSPGLAESLQLGCGHAHANSLFISFFASPWPFSKSYSVVQTYPASLLHIAVSAAAARVSVAVSVCMCGANPCDCLQPCLYMFPIPWLQGTTIIVQDTYLMSLQIHAGLKFVSSHSYICNEVVFYIHQTKHTLPIHSLF